MDNLQLLDLTALTQDSSRLSSLQASGFRGSCLFLSTVFCVFQADLQGLGDLQTGTEEI